MPTWVSQDWVKAQSYYDTEFSLFTATACQNRFQNDYVWFWKIVNTLVVISICILETPYFKRVRLEFFIFIFLSISKFCTWMKLQCISTVWKPFKLLEFIRHAMKLRMAPYIISHILWQSDRLHNTSSAGSSIVIGYKSTISGGEYEKWYPSDEPHSMHLLILIGACS